MKGQPNGHTIAFRSKHLGTNEVIFGYLEGWINSQAASGTNEIQAGQLILTNRRLCLYRKGLLGDHLNEIDLAQITSTDEIEQFGFRYLRVQSSTKELRFHTTETKETWELVLDRLEKVRADPTWEPPQSITNQRALTPPLVSPNLPVARFAAPGQTPVALMIDRLARQNVTMPNESETPRAASEKLRRSGAKDMSLPKGILLGVGAFICVMVVLVAVPDNNSKLRKPNDPPMASASPVASTSSPTAMSKADRLKAMDAKINQIVLLPLDGKYDPDGYAKLGKRVWGVSNDLRRWVAFAALQNDGCDYVYAIAVWEEATRSQLSWHVVCGDKRFVISEEQARTAKASFDSDEAPPDRVKSAEFTETPPKSTSTLSASDAGALCMEATKNRIRHPSTADFSILGSGFKKFDDGTAIFGTTFTARNDFNLELEYQVACDFTGSTLTDVKIVEAR